MPRKSLRICIRQVATQLEVDALVARVCQDLDPSGTAFERDDRDSLSRSPDRLRRRRAIVKRIFATPVDPGRPSVRPSLPKVASALGMRGHATVHALLHYPEEAPA